MKYPVYLFAIALVLVLLLPTAAFAENPPGNNPEEFQSSDIENVTENHDNTNTDPAVDLSDNDLTAEQLAVSAMNDTCITLEAPSSVHTGELFSVEVGLNSNRHDVYVIRIQLEYTETQFDYAGIREMENDVYVLHVDHSLDGTILIDTFSNQPITGEKAPMFFIDFIAREGAYTTPGYIEVREAMASAVPDDFTIQANTSTIQVTVSGTADEIPAAEVTYRNVAEENGNWILRSMNPVSAASIGDANQDGKVDIVDLAIAMYYYGVEEGNALWENAVACDVTGTGDEPDGIVDILDLAFIARMIF